MGKASIGAGLNWGRPQLGQALIGEGLDWDGRHFKIAGNE